MFVLSTTKPNTTRAVAYAASTGIVMGEASNAGETASAACTMTAAPPIESRIVRIVLRVFGF